MKLNYAVRSLLMLIVAIAFLIILTLSDSALAGTSLGLQNLIIVLTLILTPAVGILFGVLSLIRKNGQTWLAVLCVIANTLFALFHLALTFFAG